MVLLALTMTLGASAQFEQGKKYISASLSGLDLSYNGSQKWDLNIDAKGGYCLEDNWMVLAKVGIERRDNESGTALELGVGGRYYIIQNGLYLGANCTYKHRYHTVDDLMPGIEIGYAYFINHHVTIEPAVYYDQSLKDHSNYSSFGFRIGLGVYF